MKILTHLNPIAIMLVL